MPGIRVVTDSACDLPDEVLTEHGIGLVPLRIRFGDEELVDREELPTKDFWARARSFAGLPATAAPSPGHFREAFVRMAGEGADGVVCVSLSSKLSATIEAARQAARDLQGRLPVLVVDSLNVTLGQGLQVLIAAQAAEEEKGLDEVADAVAGAQSRLLVFAAFDTLENLRNGGRIGGAQAMIGSMLAIKPVIEVRDGEVAEESKQRTRGRSLRYLAAKVHAAGPLERMAAFGADAPDLDDFLALIADVKPAVPIVVGEIGPVIGTHCGPGAIGVAMLRARPAPAGH
ncbi:MAG TPA: DegV family protein [Acidimicrobiales bacterium]|jgi:DegV family protein with EDD domain|nr:DegV family protein [Acidimicrobiales bacterium]